MPLQDFQLPRPTTQRGAELQDFIVSRGRHPAEFSDEQAASVFRQQAMLNEEGVKAGLAPEDIAMQAQQLGIPVAGPLANAIVAAPVDISVPAFARGYAEAYKKKEAEAIERLKPAGAAGGVYSQIMAKYPLPEEVAPSVAGPLEDASVGRPEPVPAYEGGGGSVNEAGEFTPAPPDIRKLGIDVDPVYHGIAGSDPRQVVYQRLIPQLVSKKTAEWMRTSGNRAVTFQKQAQLRKEAEFDAAGEVGYKVKPNNLGQPSWVEITPVKPEKRQVTGAGGDTYEVEVNTDGLGRVVSVAGGDPRHVKAGPATLNQRQFDKVAITDIADYNANRSHAMQGNISALERANKSLEAEVKKGGWASGPYVGPASNIPVVGRMFFRTNKDIKRDVEVAGIAGMKAALGAAFTRVENEQFLARSFDDYASDEQNLTRAKGLLEVLKQQKAALDARSVYFRKHGTLYKYDGPQPLASADEIYSARDGLVAEQGVPPVGAANKAPAQGDDPAVLDYLQSP